MALRIWAASVTVVAATLVAVLTVEYRQQSRDVQDDTGQALRAVAATAALALDGNAHQSLQSVADARLPAYDRLKAQLIRVQKANGLEDYDVLTLRRKGQGMEFVIGLRDAVMIGSPYAPPPAVQSVLDQVFATGQAQATAIYTDGFGTFVSAFAPIVDRLGAVVGLLEVDNDVSLLLARARQRLWRQIAIGVAALVVAFLLTVPIARSMTRSISRLSHAMEQVEAGHYDVTAAVDSQDEIGVLARVFESMLRGLRERLAMLRFVPRHTQAMIAEGVREHPGAAATFIARKRNLAVLFSDIRGFTTLSDELPPDRIIAMLNIYLRQESEIVTQHNGSVDKFIGDAVMAIFEGPNRFADASDAALAIQAAFKNLNTIGAFERPVHVGIGIAGGDLVMGGVGSEDRMELAVIGRLVNLASRLTSVAAGGEVVVSEWVFDQLGEQFAGEKREKVRLKGFAQDQVSYRLVGRKAV